MHILDFLARTQMGPSVSFTGLIQQEYIKLPWGTTLILITGKIDEELMRQLFQVRRAGLNLVLILVGGDVALQEKRQAEQFNIPVYLVRSEQDIDQWRR